MVNYMLEKLMSYLQKPELFAQSTSKFWDDEHISLGMLEAHLNPEFEGATRNHKFVDQSVDWIAKIAPPDQYPKLLDLGCGPGLYAQRFYQKGYNVTGIDFSRRSLEYAGNFAKKNEYAICYQYQDYLSISYQSEFDLITLIYCDFCVLSDSDRRILLDKIFNALKSNGKFIVDVTTPNSYKEREETKNWTYNEGDFWSDKPHLCLNAFYRYDESNTMLNQAVILTEDSIQSYYLWDHTFTLEELTNDLKEAGFDKIDFYSDVAGAKYEQNGHTMCAVATKREVC